MAAPDDPRGTFGAALDQMERHVARVGTDDLGRATPCGDFDVHALVAHVVAVLRKLTVVTRGEDTSAVPDPAVDVGDRVAEEVRVARAALDRAWADDVTLDRDHHMAWGTMTGRELVDAYAHEVTVHAWDLARALGHDDDLDPVLAEAALVWFRANVPADDRSAGGPFGPVVEVPADADPYPRLAGFVGRRPYDA